MDGVLIAGIAIIGFPLLVLIFIYNGHVNRRNAVDYAFASIDVQLKKLRRCIRPHRARTRSSTSRRTEGDETGTQHEDVTIPEFNVSTRVTGAGGTHDKIESSYKNGHVIGSREEIDLFRLKLGAASTEDRSEEYSNQHGKYCNVAPENGRLSKPLTVRNSSIEWGGNTLSKPPFSGRVTAWRKQVGIDKYMCNLGGDFHLNPTMAYNLLGNGLTFDKDTLLSQRSSEEALKGIDGKHNVLSLSRIANARGRGCESYIKAVYDAMNEEFEQASLKIDSLPMQGNIHFENFSLRRVETYWEFSTPDADALLKRLKPALKAYHKEHRDRTHGFNEERIANENSIRLYLTNGVEIIVYAKLDGRIRMEVALKPPKQNGLLKGGYTATSLNGLFSKLSACREESAKRLNSLMVFLERWGEVTPSERANEISYEVAWLQALGVSSRSVSLLRRLKTSGLILGGGKLTSEQRNTLRRAKENGLVFYDSTARAYYPSALESEDCPSMVDGLTQGQELGHIAGTQPVNSPQETPYTRRIAREVNRILPSPPLLPFPFFTRA